VIVSGLAAALEEVDITDVQVSVDFAEWMTSMEMETMSDGIYEIMATVTVNGDVEYNEELMIRLEVTEVVEETDETVETEE